MHSQLRLQQLVSPALPIGCYAYSQGLEAAIEQAWVYDEDSTKSWLRGILKNAVVYNDLAVFVKIYQASNAHRVDDIIEWNQYILALRETSELYAEDIQVGGALKKLLTDLAFARQDILHQLPMCSYVSAFSLACATWNIPLSVALGGFSYAWVENQIATAIKLVPLGQTSGQRILSQLFDDIAAVVIKSQKISDQDIGFSLPAFSIGSSLHETQYTRLFRS